MKGFTVMLSAALLGVALLIPATSQGTHGRPGACDHATITAGNGGKVVVGTPGPDIIKGGRGADTIYGRGGNDKICGGPGPDRVFGQRGNDRMWGNHAPDLLVGGRGFDRARGGPGDDVCRAERKRRC